MAKKRYQVFVKGAIVIEAENAEDAEDEIANAIEDVQQRNCGGIEDDLLAGLTVNDGEAEEYNDE
ncbi:MAG: hypothetical protein Q7R56_01750 [Nanoarchaeota archaeon]|nr:hypothetical protein [Nanoarchaeota archaeon]